MINLPLRQIQSLICLAEAGSFHGAAARLGVSQPAVSAHIRALEERFGVSLVHRTTRRVALTPEGTAFVARALRAFSELELAARGLQDLSAAHRGQVMVACVPPLMSSLMPRVIRAMEISHPMVEVRLRDVVSSQLDGLVARGEAEIGIGPRRAGSELAFHKLRRDEFVAVMARDHPLAKRREVRLAELAAYPVIANSRDTNAGQMIDQALRRLPRPVRPRFELIHYVSVERFVEAGLGVAVLPRTALDALASERIVALDLRGPRLSRDIGLMWRKGYRPSPAGAAFIEVLRREIGTAAAS